MNRTRQNLIYATLLLVGALLGCRTVAEHAIETGERRAGPAITKQAGHAIENATRQRVRDSLRRAAEEGGERAVERKFDQLSSANGDSAFKEYFQSLGEKSQEKLRECLLKEAMNAAASEDFKKTELGEELTKTCFGETTPAK